MTAQQNIPEPTSKIKVTRCLTALHEQCIGEYVTIDTIRPKYTIKCLCLCHDRQRTDTQSLPHSMHRQLDGSGKKYETRLVSGLSLVRGYKLSIHTDTNHKQLLSTGGQPNDNSYSIGPRGMGIVYNTSQIQYYHYSPSNNCILAWTRSLAFLMGSAVLIAPSSISCKLLAYRRVFWDST